MNHMEQAMYLLVLNVLMSPIVIIGVVLCCGRGADLIAGYNSARPEERARWNEKALCRGTGVLVLVIAGAIELSLLGAVLNVMPLTWSGAAAMVLAAPGGLLYISRSRRFKKPGGDR